MIRFGSLNFKDKAEYERFIEARQVVAPLCDDSSCGCHGVASEHIHEIVWVDDAFYCLSCGSGFSEDEAKTSLTTGAALASCEICGKAFDPRGNMFELGEYAFCGVCNKW